jgi:hypothetical protein
MGASDSKQAPHTGLITVSAPGTPAARGVVGDDALIRHLEALKAKAPQASAPQLPGQAADVFRDLQSVRDHGQDTEQLRVAVEGLVRGCHAAEGGGGDAVAQIIANQAHIHRLADQAQIKAARAQQHTKLQASRLKTLGQQLAVVQGLPEQLAELCEQAERLQAQMQRLQAAVHAPPPQPQ